ncbi:MAG: prephenate dehydrogenase/arogenate dehydrogenase family protein [Candidatus Micrarchaeia archaeon]
MAFAFPRVAIIGGSGAFGSWYARFFKSKGGSVVVCSRSAGGADVAKAIGADFSTDAKDACASADLVIVSVPIDAVPAALKEASASAKKGSLLIDFASVKKNAVSALAEISKTRPDLELASVHPMHGPRAESVDGVAVVFIPVTAGAKCTELKKIFESEGARVVESTADEHDSVLSVVQGLTHFACMAHAAAMRDAGTDVARAREFASPLFEVFLGAVGRVVLQNPDVYAKIQVENPLNARMRELFVKGARELSAIADKGDAQALAKKIRDAGKSFKSAEEVLFESDKATSAMDAEARQLRLLAGKKVALENVQAKAVHYGTLKEAKAGAVVLLENSKPVRLNLSNVRLLGKAEFSQWRNRHLKKKSRDYSVVVPQNADNGAVASVIAATGGVENAFVAGSFEGSQVGAGKKSVTIRCEFFEDEDARAIDADVKKIISGLGFSLR